MRVIKHVSDDEKWSHVEPAPPQKNCPSPTSPGGSKKKLVVKNGQGVPCPERDSHSTRKTDAKEPEKRRSYQVHGGWGNPFELGAPSTASGSKKPSPKKTYKKKYRKYEGNHNKIR